MAKQRGTGLASRFRAAIDARIESRKREEAERRRRIEASAESRAKLMADLAAFGRAVDHFEVTAKGLVVVFRFDGRTLRFEGKGPADRVRVKGDGLERDRELFLHSELEKWVLVGRTAGGREDQTLLFDAGLEMIVGQAFDLRAAETEPVEPSPAAVDSEEQTPDEDTPARTL